VVLWRVLEVMVPVRRGERQLTLTLFFHSLFAVGAFLTGRTVRDALFLSHGHRDKLAWMYVLSAIFVTVTGVLYAKVANRVRRDVMALASAVFFGTMFLGLWVLERHPIAGIYPIIYVAVEVMGAMVLVQFWTLANELFTAREAKRLYGIIGAGGTFANILIGLAGARVATALGTPALLVLCAGLLFCAGAASYFGGKFGRQRLFSRAATGKPKPALRSGGASRVFSDSHLRTVALLSAVTFFTTTFIDFQFKVVAGDALKGDALAAYFGYFSACVGALALGLQLFGTSRLLNRAGVIGALAVLPLSLALGDAVLLLFPSIWAASLTKGADTLFRYSVNDATTQILYLPAQAHIRVSAKAFIDGVVKPVAIGVAGLTLAGYRLWFNNDAYRLAWLSFALALAWLAVVASMRSKYLTSLQTNLKLRRLDLDSARHHIADGSTNHVIEHALDSTNSQEVLNALALLPHLGKVQLDERVEPLLEHPVPEVRVKALDYYAHRQSMRFANSVFRRFEDGEPAVRAAAIDAFCAMGRDKAVRSVRPFLSDVDPRIRSSAITGMIRFGGLDGVLVAAEALKALIDHEDPVMRQHGAKVLGAIGVRNFYQPILQLMNDVEPRVRREAVTAAGALRSPEFVLPLIHRTHSHDTLREAVESLTAYGPSIIDTLSKVMSNHLEDAPIRRAVARVLGKLGTSEAVEVISRHLDEPDDELRAVLYRALARAVKGTHTLLKDLSPVKRAIEKELDRAFRGLHQAETLHLDMFPSVNTPMRGAVAARALLTSAMADKLKDIEGRIFLLLAVLYPDADMEHISAGIRDASGADATRRRGNAVELLENLLDRDLKHRFLALVEDIPRRERLSQVSLRYPAPTLSPEATLRELMQDEAPWIRACAVWCHAESVTKATEPDAALARALRDPHPVVREMALVALHQTSNSNNREWVESGLTDDSELVRRQAANLLRDGVSTSG
jgi:AAA family ATP:ADP antiporter